MKWVFALLLLWSSIALAQPNVDKAKALFEEAQTLYKLQKYEDALRKYEEAYVLSKEPALFFNIGQCYRLLGKPTEAARSYRNFLKEQPDTPQRAFVEELISDMDALAARGLNQADLERAAKSFEEAETHYKLQQYEAALKSYETSYRLSKEPDLLYNIAQCYRQLGKKQEAVRGYKAFLRENPNTKERSQVEETISTLEKEIALEAKSRPSPPTSVTNTFKITEKISPAGTLYGLAGTLTGSWLVTGAIALRLSAKAQDLSLLEDGESALPDQIRELQKQTRTLSLISDLSLGLAIGSALGGFILSKRDKTPDVSLAPVPGGALAKVGFSW